MAETNCQQVLLMCFASIKYSLSGLCPDGSKGMNPPVFGMLETQNCTISQVVKHFLKLDTGI